MSELAVLNLSRASGQDNQLGELPVPKVFGDISLDQISTLTAAECDLVGLSVSPDSLLYSLVTSITELRVPFNHLTSIAGVEYFTSLEILELHHNHIEALDLKTTSLLRRLERLTELDVSHNQLRLVDFEGSAEEGDLLYLSVLNLSHNALIEIPDLRSLPSLLELNVNYNKIEDITEVESRLPLLSLQCVKLRRNALPTVTSVVPLTALAQTLRHIELCGNSFSSLDEKGATSLRESSPSRRGSLLMPSPDQPFWWRPFVLFLLPLLETIDMVEFTRSEKQATALLFRDHQSELAKNFLELMNPHQKDELVNYLVKKCEHVIAPADMVDIVLATEEEEELYLKKPIREKSATSLPVERRPPPPPTSSELYSASPKEEDNGVVEVLPYHGSPHPRSRSIISSSTTSVAQTPTQPKSASFAEVIKAMQQKLKSLSSVVEVLYREDMIRKKFAAIVIQKYMRGALVRMHLSAEEAMHCNAIRERLRRLSAPSGVGAYSSVYGEAPPVLSPTSAANMREVLLSMKGLQGAIQTMCGELDQYRAMLDREERRAAIVIQKYYRGYVARREWRVMKEDYEEFVQSLSSYVELMQRVGRGFRARRHLQTNVVPRLEVFRLRSDVRTLQEQIIELRALVEKKDVSAVRSTQPRLSIDYTTDGRDPREEMEAIMRNYEKHSGPIGHRLQEEKEKEAYKKKLLSDNIGEGMSSEERKRPFLEETPDRLEHCGSDEYADNSFVSEPLREEEEEGEEEGEEEEREEEEREQEESDVVDLLESPNLKNDEL